MQKKQEKKILIQSLGGMHDILPQDQFFYRRFERVFEKLCSLYNFKRIDTPILERAELFIKGTGAITDIIQKEMYSFRTRGGDLVALRPEGTPPIIRAYLEHGMVRLPQPVKLYYYGSFFRHESPQSGRYREFKQLGIETLGERSAYVDAETISLIFNIISNAGLKDLIVEINSLGCRKCNPRFKNSLVRYLKKFKTELCQHCKIRIETNPLRVLDCKNESCNAVIENAPQMIDFLCQDCSDHFKEVLEFLDILEIPYTLNPYLVRGLDYYIKTVFEIFSIEGKEDLDKEINNKRRMSLAGGGRFDHLVKIYNKRELPACGGAIGVERVIDELKSIGVQAEEEKPQVYLVQIGDSARKLGLKILEEVRSASIRIEAHLNKDNIRDQLGKVDRVGTRFVLILGQKEAIENKILIRDMKLKQQDLVRIEDLIPKLKKLIKK